MGSTRIYSDKTIKQLFGQSGNRCAHPDCENRIIAPGNDLSESAVLGQICHIYAASDDGPRGNPSLTALQRNLPSNLILLCAHHHTLVDKQPETYPASLLLTWKAAREAELDTKAARVVRQEANALLLGLLDGEVTRLLGRLVHGRFLQGFPTRTEALQLGRKVEGGELSVASSEIRAKALAWCARVLSTGEDRETAESFLNLSTRLATTEEGAIAHAFLTSNSNKNGALLELKAVGTPAARSAALRLVMNSDGVDAALPWLSASGLCASDLDPEGKSTYLHAALASGAWNELVNGAEALTDPEVVAEPLLASAKAMGLLISAVPNELRSLAASGIPFEADNFPLKDKPADLDARRRSTEYFRQVGQFAADIGAPYASNVALDYALWLELRDPQFQERGLELLRESMRDPVHSLRRLNFALRFGLKVDRGAIEKQIDQSVAMTGTGTADEAFARYTLAFAQKGPKEAAEYLAKHRAQLGVHLHTHGVLATEVEVLARAGMIDAANERLNVAIAEGLSTRDQDMLRRIIAVKAGADPVAEFRLAHEADPTDLRTLNTLVHEVDKADRWEDLAKFAAIKFERTQAVDDCFLVAKALNELDRQGDLFTFLSANEDLVAQSVNLQTLWAGTLYREGRFAEAREQLDKVGKARSRYHRALRVDIAIASGDWEDLFAYCSEVWTARDTMSGFDLLQAAQIAQAIGAPNAAEMRAAAATKSPADPGVLAGAYFQSVKAGEENRQTVTWLQTAANLSNDDGPIKSVTLQELLKEKPEWDKQANSVWEQLNGGKLPIFAAALLMRRSLLEYVLLPALSNLKEPDVRKRQIIYGFSGARFPAQTPIGRKVALDYAAILTCSLLGILDPVIDHFDVVIPHGMLGWLFREREKAEFHQPSRIKEAHALKQLMASGVVTVFDRKAQEISPYLATEVGEDLAAMLARAEVMSGRGTHCVVIRSSPVHRLGSLMEEQADLSDFSTWLASCTSVVDWMDRRGLLTREESDNARAYLAHQEQSWPGQATIPDDAEFYLDNLSVSYLRTTGLLEKFRGTSAKVFVNQSEDEEANVLIELESSSGEQFKFIDAIRKSLAGAIAVGKVRAVRSTNLDPEQEFKAHPSFNVLSLVEPVDAIVIDDRYLNQHATMTIGDRQTRLGSSLDVIDKLHTVGAISNDERLSLRTKLRLGGYQLMPVQKDELKALVTKAIIVDGVVVETAELRAIRQSLQRARMSNVVQLPLEQPFLHGLLASINFAIRELWVEAPDTATAVARADWILGIADVRAWAGCAIKGNERGFAVYGSASYLLQLISAPLNAERGLRGEYFAWITDRVLGGVKEYQPEVFEWLVARAKELTVSGVQDGAKELEGT